MIIDKVFRDLDIARYHLANARKNLIKISDFGAQEVHEMIQKIDKLQKERNYERMDDR